MNDVEVCNIPPPHIDVSMAKSNLFDMIMYSRFPKPIISDTECGPLIGGVMVEVLWAVLTSS